MQDRRDIYIRILEALKASELSLSIWGINLQSKSFGVVFLFFAMMALMMFGDTLVATAAKIVSLVG